MKWVTREHARTDRIACPWLIRKFIDPEAEIVYVGRDEVLAFAEQENAISFDAPGARYTPSASSNSNSRCTTRSTRGRSTRSRTDSPSRVSAPPGSAA